MDKLQFLSLEATYEVDSTFDSERFLKLNARIAHDGKNPNGSHFTVDGFDKAKTSLAYTPILAHIVQDSEGNYDFGSHDMRIEDNAFKEGDYKVIYEEVPMGVVPVLDENDYEIKEHKGRKYVYISMYVWRGYSNYGEDIILRDKKVKLSIEIIVDKFTYDAKQDLFFVSDFRFKGVTLLGKNIGTGMIDAAATTEEFSEKKNEAIQTIMSELKEEIEKNQSFKKVEINNTQKKEDKVLDEKLKLIAEYNLNADSLDFKIDDLSVEDLKAKLIEMSEKEEDPKLLAFATYREKYETLRKTVNSMESKEDYTFYFLMDFDNDYLFIDRYLWDDNSGNYEESYHRVTYTFDDKANSASITGELETIYHMWLTSEEKGKIEQEREEFKQLKADFDTYKENYNTPKSEVDDLLKFKTVKLAEERKLAEKAIFEKFSKLNDNKEFEELKKNAHEYELGILEEKCFALLGKVNFELSEPEKKSSVKLPVDGEVVSTHYGGIIEYYRNKK